MKIVWYSLHGSNERGVATLHHRKPSGRSAAMQQTGGAGSSMHQLTQHQLTQVFKKKKKKNSPRWWQCALWRHRHSDLPLQVAARRHAQPLGLPAPFSHAT